MSINSLSGKRGETKETVSRPYALTAVEVLDIPIVAVENVGVNEQSAVDNLLVNGSDV